ncbi:MAG: NAD-dependent epimerase/dehydratase family protein [Bacteroidales bacterium]|jgi:nucleoside-diphosphate-sugar epimerase
MNRVLVTGANGLLGTNLVIYLLEQDYYVKALVREKKKFIQYHHPHLEVVIGDICNISSVEPHAADCDYIIHSAAITAQDLLNEKEYENVNINGTKNIIEICKKYKIKRLIYIGSANTFGYGSLEDLGDETKTTRSPFTKSHYAISKVRAQEIVDQSCSEVNIVTISPTFMIGAYDAKPSSGKIILMAAGKKILFYPPGGKNFVHVKDVAKASIRALTIGASGEKYLLANANLTFKQFYKIVSSKTNSHPLLIKIPKLILYLFGLIGEIIRLPGIRTEISLTNVRILTINNYYSNQKAKNMLGIQFTPIGDAVLEAVDWFRKEKMLKV